MDVNFSQKTDLVDPDILIQQMEECQIGINSECNNKRNQIVARLKTWLSRIYLMENPELAIVVPQDGPHYQVMMNTFGDIASLSLELIDLRRKWEEYYQLVQEINSKTNAYYQHQFDGGRGDWLAFCQDQISSLESIRDHVKAGAKMRLDYEPHHWKYASRVQKLIDLVKKANDADTVSGAGDPEDFFGKLKTVIYGSMTESLYYEYYVQKFVSLPEEWELQKEKEEGLLNWVARQMELWEIMEKMERGGFRGTNESASEAIMAHAKRWNINIPEAEQNEEPDYSDDDHPIAGGCFCSLRGILKKCWSSPTN